MDLTPNDIRNYEFPNQMRGYDKEEVNSFLDQIANILEQMKQENLRLSMENDSVKSQLENLKQFEDTIKSAAIDARKNADEMLSRTKEQAEQMLEDARSKAANIIAEQDQKIKEYTTQLERLEHTKESFVNELRDMVNLHLDMVKKVADTEFSYTPDMSYDTGTPENTTPSDNLEVTDSEEVSRQEMTTIASKPKEEKIVTEEANAAEDTVSIEEQIARAQAEAEAETNESASETEQTPANEEPVRENAPLDPELAQALAGYEHPEPMKKDVTPDTVIGYKDAPKLGEVVETTKRAEDIPEGFIATESELVHQEDTSFETDKVKIDQSVEPGIQKPISPDNIVEELDNVVAKFEEEIEKAEKN